MLLLLYMFTDIGLYCVCVLRAIEIAIVYESDSDNDNDYLTACGQNWYNNDVHEQNCPSADTISKVARPPTANLRPESATINVNRSTAKWSQ